MSEVFVPEGRERARTPLMEILEKISGEKRGIEDVKETVEKRKNEYAGRVRGVLREVEGVHGLEEENRRSVAMATATSVLEAISDLVREEEKKAGESGEIDKEKVLALALLTHAAFPAVEEYLKGVAREEGREPRRRVAQRLMEALEKYEYNINRIGAMLLISGGEMKEWWEKRKEFWELVGKGERGEEAGGENPYGASHSAEILRAQAEWDDMENRVYDKVEEAIREGRTEARIAGVLLKRLDELKEYVMAMAGSEGKVSRLIEEGEELERAKRLIEFLPEEKRGAYVEAYRRKYGERR